MSNIQLFFEQTLKFTQLFSDGLVQNISSPHTELYLQALLKYTNYTIKVAGFSNYGIGPFSYPVYCTTLQDGKTL